MHRKRYVDKFNFEITEQEKGTATEYAEEDERAGTYFDSQVTSLPAPVSRRLVSRSAHNPPPAPSAEV